MSGTRLNRWMRNGAVAATAIILLAGCGETPLGPASLELSGGSATAPSASEQAARFGTGTGGSVAVLTEAQVQALLGGAAQVTSATSVVGTNGGSVKCGRFTVTVPSGAFRGTAVVTVRLGGPAADVVDLAISPANLNNFRKDVSLSYDTAGLASTDGLTIFWYDPSTKNWVNLGATKDPKTGLPTVSLKHFSVYRAGKAGW